jgi:hypothetical protein
MLRRKHLPLVLAALLLLSIALLYPWQSQTFSYISPLSLLLPIRDPTHGSWIPSAERSGDADKWVNTCHADFSPEAGGSEGRDGDAEEKIRAKKVAAWEWILEDGKPVRPWDKDAFIERALKSRGGIIVIGGT